MDLLCKWCGETKPAEEFLRRDTSRPYSQSNVRCCKLCNTKRNRQRYDNPSIREKQLAANAKWRYEHRDRQNELADQYAVRNPEVMQARYRVQHLLRRGYWTRQPCAICGTTDAVEAHHDSYAKPHWDTVRWLCKRHHELWHRHLDPIKKPILQPALALVSVLRDDARAKLDLIYQLRREVSELKALADDLELEAWTEVQKIAAPEYERFRKNTS